MDKNVEGKANRMVTDIFTSSVNDMHTSFIDSILFVSPSWIKQCGGFCTPSTSHVSVCDGDDTKKMNELQPSSFLTGKKMWAHLSSLLNYIATLDESLYSCSAESQMCEAMSLFTRRLILHYLSDFLGKLKTSEKTQVQFERKTNSEKITSCWTFFYIDLTSYQMICDLKFVHL